MDMLHEVCNSLDDVTFFTMSSNVFFYYDDMLNNFYKPFKSGTMQVNHYFMVNNDNATTMVMKTFIDNDSQETFDFAKNNNLNNNNRKLLLEQYIIKPLRAPGMKDIKQVELWKNWRQFVPQPYKDMICPRPTADVIDRVKKQRSAKQKETNTRKRAAARRTNS